MNKILLLTMLASFNCIASSGQPSTSATILIRGTNSINGDTEPLFFIEGNFYRETPLFIIDLFETDDDEEEGGGASSGTGG